MDFSRHAEFTEVTMSPDGNHLALSRPTSDGTETELVVVPLDGSGQNQVLRFGRQHHVTDVIWSADDQLVLSRAEMEPLKARPYSTGELFTSDVRGKNQRTLFAYIPGSGSRAAFHKDAGFASVVKVLDQQPGTILVDFTAWPRSAGDENLTTAIYKVDTRTGRRELQEQVRESATFTFDHAGRARLRTTYDNNDRPVLMYRPDAAADWKPVPRSLAGWGMSLLHVEADNNTAYATISDDGEPAALYRVDLAAGTRTRLAGRPDMAIAGVLRAGFDGPPYGVFYDAVTPTIDYLDKQSEWARLHSGLLARFPGRMISEIDWSRDNRKLLFHAWGDRHPGSWYILDRDQDKIRLVSEATPWLKPESLVSSTPVTFKARDGLVLHGFYTAPADGRSRPLVVIPHGGPHGPYDTWSYDPDAQFLASRGYGVLQVNYRGSGGRGREFMESGYREWGGKMQDDIADGVRWAIENKFADPQRICTFGASYGGYAALMQTIRYPELYRCAIGYVGVYDLEVMKKEGDIRDRASGKRYLERALGNDVERLREWSPARNVDKIKVPVLLAHGGLDRRVPMDQFNALKRAFNAAGTPVETMVVSGEAHGFYKPENRAELYRRIEAFLQQHIGSGVH